MTLLAAGLAAQQPYPAATLTGPALINRSIGRSVAPAGDVDLDGNPDLLVGFPSSFTSGSESTSDQLPSPAAAGLSGFHVWSPRTGALVRTVVDPAFCLRGYAVLNLGDLNGDGKPDHAVSDPLTGGVNWAGRVDAYSGADGSILWSFLSTVPGGSAGASLARIADIDTDGKADVLVGSIGMGGVAGRVFVLSAQTGALLRTHVGAVGDNLGYATSDAGDVDGDGTSDYAAGAPQTNVIGVTQPPGYVRIWSGATGAVIRTVNGAANFDRFGRAIAKAGDLNGDGVPDLFVGAPSRFALSVPGRVYGISGASGAVILNASRGVNGDRFGFGLAAIGDRNGDGKIDFAAGTAVGIVEVRSGAFGGVLYVQSGIAGQNAMQGLAMAPVAVGDLDADGSIDLAIASPNAGENGAVAVYTSFTVSAMLAGDEGHGVLSDVAALGDLDGDGIRELAIANYEANTPNLVNAGSVLIRSGTGATLGQLYGAANYAGFGWGVTTLDDVDGDSVEDFLVSTLNAASSVSCYSGATGAVLYTATGPAPAGAFGYSLVRLSDFDGDGIRDFAAGAPYTPIAGSPTVGQLHLCSGATGAIFMTVNGLAGSDFFGAHIAEIGDLNGDNVPELLVSAGYASPGGIPGAGLARVVSGANGAILRTHNGTAAGIACGNGVAGTGDVDGDLVPDYAVASPANTASGGPAGPVVVYSGATGLVIRTIGPTPIPPGLSTNDTFGRALTNAGDLDGDGVADLLLAANPYLAAGPSREIHAYSGATGALISRMVQTAAFTPNIAFPHSAGFDLTGDGALDWVVGQYPTGPTASGALLVSFAGIPAGSTSVGSGCNVAGGPSPVLQTGGGGLVAAVGAPAFELLLSRANPGQAGALAVGVSNTSWNGQALPLDLTPFGLPGCFLHNSVDALFGFVATAGGLYGFPAPLPALPSLAGTTAHVQGFLVGAGGAITAATNGLTIVVQ